MPNYEFQCKCGNKFSQVCSMGVNKAICECKKTAKKVPSVSAFILKGGGYASDDKLHDNTKNYWEKETDKITKEVFG